MQASGVFRLGCYSLWILLIAIPLPQSGAQYDYFPRPYLNKRSDYGELDGRIFGIIGEFFHQWGCNIKEGLFNSPCSPPPSPPPRPPPRPPPPPPPPPRPPPPPPPPRIEYVPLPVPVPVPVPNRVDIPFPVPVPEIVTKYIPLPPWIPPPPLPPWGDPLFDCCFSGGRRYCNSPRCSNRGRSNPNFYRFRLG